MGVLDTISRRALALKAQPAQPRSVALRALPTPMDRWSLPDVSLVERQANLYANLYWMQIAIGRVAEAVATTSFSVQRRTKDGLTAIEDHPFELLLEQPNPDQDQFEFLEATVSWRLITGNCYWWLNATGEGAEPDELWIIPSQNIQPVPDGSMSIKGYLYDDGAGSKVALEPWEVVHFKSFNPLNKYIGLSATQAMAMDAMGDLGAQEYNARFYDKGRIKGQGILAFADMIDDGKWKRLAADWEEQHGGRQNKGVIRLRGVGTGVNWIPTALSQVETQYLETRQFTKEAIYARFAPGLAAILDPNATEASATAGNDTFLTKAVYPMNMALSKKMTQRVILPCYGVGLVGAFEDVRRADTAIELQQRAAYERTHTVDETRQKYDGDGPIGDGRGKLLPAEIGKGLTDARPPEEKPSPIVQPPVADLTAAGKALDRQRWQTVALKALAAGRAPGGRAFDPDYLSDAEAIRIRAALLHATTEEDVKAAFV